MIYATHNQLIPHLFLIYHFFSNLHTDCIVWLLGSLPRQQKIGVIGSDLLHKIVILFRLCDFFSRFFEIIYILILRYDQGR